MSETHPLPWHVEYKRYDASWHEKSMPRIMDANGVIVMKMFQSDDVGHPGSYDAKADETAHRIVDAMNFQIQLAETAKEIAPEYPGIETVNAWEKLYAIKGSYFGTESANQDFHELMEVVIEKYGLNRDEILEMSREISQKQRKGCL